MRLYLSSQDPGSRAGALLSLLSGPRVAVIANGHDAMPMPRATEASLAAFRTLGLAPQELDLRAHFGDPASLGQRLAGYHLVWVLGGNSFVLRRAMRQSGFDAVIGELMAADALVYGGQGAGAVVAGPSLNGLELMDDPFALPEGYDEPPVWSGLGLTPFVVVPRYPPPHREAAAAEKVVSYMRARRTRFRALAAEPIVRSGTVERLAS
jgi:dipeptidase E